MPYHSRYTFWWSCKLVLLSLLLCLGISDRLLAQYFPEPATVQWSTQLSSFNEALALKAERVAQVGDFDTDKLSMKYGQIRFERGTGRYAFDEGKEGWYKKSVKLDRFYKPFAKDYIAPWKLIPEGETDVVTAKYTGDKTIAPAKLVFASEPKSAALPASYDAGSKRWKESQGGSFNYNSLK